MKKGKQNPGQTDTIYHISRPFTEKFKIQEKFGKFWQNKKQLVFFKAKVLCLLVN